jgi:hypothetical protein
MKSRSILLVFLGVTFLMSLLGAIFSGRSASLAADSAKSSEARGWAIGSSVVNSFNIAVCIVVGGLYIFLKRKEQTE